MFAEGSSEKFDNIGAGSFAEQHLAIRLRSSADLGR